MQILKSIIKRFETIKKFKIVYWQKKIPPNYMISTFPGFAAAWVGWGATLLAPMFVLIAVAGITSVLIAAISTEHKTNNCLGCAGAFGWLTWCVIAASFKVVCLRNWPRSHANQNVSQHFQRQ